MPLLLTGLSVMKQPPLIQVLCSDLAFGVAAGFVAGGRDCWIPKRFLCPALHMN